MMKPLTFALIAICLLHVRPASCQKARVLVRKPIAQGRATQQQADSLAQALRLALVHSDVVELVGEPGELPLPKEPDRTAFSGQGEEHLADEVVELRLRKSRNGFQLTLTSSVAVTRSIDTFQAEAKSLQELCTRAIPAFVHQLTERHAQEDLVIRIERGFDIYPMDKYFGVSDPFVEVRADTTLVGVTAVRQDEKDPVWNEEFRLPAVPAKEITLLVFDKDALEHRELIGTVTVPWGQDGVYPIRRPRYVRSFGRIQVSFAR